MSPNLAGRTAVVGRASVLLVGVGALGCPAATVLVRAGVGRITLLDPDRVELSNLQRQPLFTEADIGRPKVEAAAQRLNELGSASRLTAIQQRLDDTSAALVADHDLLIDACDDPHTKFCINGLAVRAGTPFIYGGVIRTSGQTMPVLPGDSACLECVFADDGSPTGTAACSELGILAPVAGVVGSYQAWSALRILGGDRSAGGRMTVYSLTGRRWRHIDFSRDELCRGCGVPRARSDHPRRLETCRS